MMSKITNWFRGIMNGALGSILGQIILTVGLPLLGGVIAFLRDPQNLQNVWMVVLTIFAVLNMFITLFLRWEQKTRLEEMFATGELIIFSAQYGVKGVATEDVSQIVRKQISNGKIDKMPVQNGLLTPGRDLAKGVTKELKVVYSVASTKTVTEKTNGNPGLLTLP